MRGSIRHSEKSQEAKLKARGLTVLYVEGRNKETWDEFAKSLRRGDTVEVTSLARIGRSRGELRGAIDKVHSKGAVIVEWDTGGRRSDDVQALVGMIFDAVDELSQDRQAFTSRTAKKAARKRWDEDDRPPRAPVREAEAAWKDTKKYPTRKAVEAAPGMQGWGYRMAYRLFGPRHPELGLGRPRKKA